MSYELSALIGEEACVRRTLAALPDGARVPLGHGLALIPLAGKLAATLRAEAGDLDFGRGGSGAARWLQRASSGAALAWVEAEFFGGAGGQCVAVYRDGRLVLRVDPPESGAWPDSPISRALRAMGVRRTSREDDEFDTVGLGRHRKTEQWLEDAVR